MEDIPSTKVFHPTLSIALFQNITLSVIFSGASVILVGVLHK